MKTIVLKRGDMVLVNLNPSEPAIQSGIRPAVIVSNNAHNTSRHPCVIICPVTDAGKGLIKFPGHVMIPAGTGGCTKDSIIMTEQIRLIRRSRIIENKGHIPDNLIKKTNDALKLVLELY